MPKEELKSILKPTNYQRDTTPLVKTGDWIYRVKAFFGYGYKEPPVDEQVADSTAQITQRLATEGAAVELGEKRSVSFADDSMLVTEYEVDHKEDYDRRSYEAQKRKLSTHQVYSGWPYFKRHVQRELSDYKRDEMEIHPQHFK